MTWLVGIQPLRCLNISHVLRVSRDHKQLPGGPCLPCCSCVLLGWVSLSRNHRDGASYLDPSAVRAQLWLQCLRHRLPQQKGVMGKGGSGLGLRYKDLSADRMLLWLPQTKGTGKRWRIAWWVVRLPSIVPNEAPVEGGKSQEVLLLLPGWRARPLCHGVDLLRVRLHLPTLFNVAQKWHRGWVKVIFLCLNEHLFSTLQHLQNMTHMFLGSFGNDADIIRVNKKVQEVPKNIID